MPKDKSAKTAEPSAADQVNSAAEQQEQGFKGKISDRKTVHQPQDPIAKLKLGDGLPTRLSSDRSRTVNLNFNWLRDLIIHDIPQSRVLAVSYPGSPTDLESDPGGWMGRNTQKGVPIVFIGYGFGLAIIQEAIELAFQEKKQRPVVETAGDKSAEKEANNEGSAKGARSKEKEVSSDHPFPAGDIHQILILDTPFPKASQDPSEDSVSDFPDNINVRMCKVLPEIDRQEDESNSSTRFGLTIGKSSTRGYPLAKKNDGGLVKNHDFPASENYLIDFIPVSIYKHRRLGRIPDHQDYIYQLIRSRMRSTLLFKAIRSRNITCVKAILDAKPLDILGEYYHSAGGKGQGKQREVERINLNTPSVYEMIYDREKGCAAIINASRKSEDTPGDFLCWWIHIPANNEQWLSDLFLSLGVRDRSMEDQRHDGLTVFNRYMHPRAKKYKFISFDVPPLTLEPNKAHLPPVEMQSAGNTKTDPANGMPFLAYESHRARKKVSKIIETAKDPKANANMNQANLDGGSALIEGYISSSKGPMHCRRTLDQYSYYMLETTERRDKDQVVSRWAKRQVKPKREVPILMVDQLWL
ncbi:hypothetical protein B0H67DRAFT_557372 [Lasiosphaeris hirsuta]|uniref:Uncharacterized protein n=1 Tax=Lasiosphaeris hirsuta TaxID=260670 RepID=A0AA40DKH0_9PEZI|nr:hypothetical protein B0H67DRAFT_557372 [Lasiosphaeris hirsuta]